ncbi:MAG: phage transcriptional regulator, AlpA [Proteobacteria bacterium]|nr:phage transcriptional regulator, AlpA [Pseudomonadota bacterium]
MENQLNGSLRVLRIKQFAHLLQLSRAAIYDRMNPKSPRHDATFPRPIRLGANSVGWLECEVDAWIAKQADCREPVLQTGEAQ